MKELPYFRFYASEWFEGNITLLDYQAQGLFINICAWYWKKDQNITISEIRLRLIKGQATLEESLNLLIKTKILKVTTDDYFTIDFLDEQYGTLRKERDKKVNSGRLGGQASVKQRLSIAQAIDKDKDNYNNKDKYKDVLKSEKIHLEQLMITFKIDESNLINLIDKFDLMNSQHQNYLEYRDHFTAWLNKQPIETIATKKGKTMNQVFDEILNPEKQ